jgi:hypothetical protein
MSPNVQAIAALRPDKSLIDSSCTPIWPGANLFELRSTLDDFELRGQPARAALADVVSRFPNNNAWPELAHAEADLSGRRHVPEMDPVLTR